MVPKASVGYASTLKCPSTLREPQWSFFCDVSNQCERYQHWHIFHFYQQSSLSKLFIAILIIKCECLTRAVIGHSYWLRRLAWCSWLVLRTLDKISPGGVAGCPSLKVAIRVRVSDIFFICLFWALWSEHSITACKNNRQASVEQWLGT